MPYNKMRFGWSNENTHIGVFFYQRVPRDVRGENTQILLLLSLFKMYECELVC